MDPKNPYDAGVSPIHLGQDDEDALGAVPVDLGPVLQRSWDLLTANVGPVAGAVLGPMIPALPVSIVLAALGVASESEDLHLVATLALLLVTAVAVPMILLLYLGSIRIFTRLARGLPVSLTMLVGEIGKLPAALLSFLLIGIAVTTGSLACALPGIVLGLLLRYAPYVMVDQEKGPIESLVDSFQLALPHLLIVFVLELVLGLGGFVLVCLTCGLGYLVVLPMTAIARAVMYHAMLGARA